MHTLERPAASEDLGAKKARLAELQAADVEKRDLEREIAEEERRQAEERLLNAFRGLDDMARDSVAKVIVLQPHSTRKVSACASRSGRRSASNTRRRGTIGKNA